LLNCYKGIAQATARQGYSIIFWQDLWDGKFLGQSYPHLYSFTNQENITLQFVLQVNDLQDLFHLALSEEAYTQFCDLHIYLQGVQITNNFGQWKYIWGSNQYSASKAYKHLIGSQPIHPAFRWLLYSSCQQKHKVFYWLLLKIGLNTRGLLQRKNMYLESYDCELCLLQHEEKLKHLFFRCSFAKNCWSQIGVNVPTWLKPERAIKHIKRILRVPFVMKIIILMCWCIW
jgi:hypothetical protein